MVQFTIDQLLDKVTLQDLANPENESGRILNKILIESATENVV